jgi:hypothetical protein
MKKIINWVSGLFKDEKGSPSSKRFVGIICALTLCITMYVNSYSHGDVKPADSLVNAVALLAFGCLGLSSADKFIAMKKDVANATKQEEEVN